jgi:hypothetical protein
MLELHHEIDEFGGGGEVAGKVGECVLWQVVGLEDVEEVGDYCLGVCSYKLCGFGFLG